MSVFYCDFTFKISDLEDGMEYEDIHEIDHTYGISYPINALNWALFGTKDVMSTTHMDAGGFSTFVCPVLGKKIWIIGLGNQIPSKEGFEDDGYVYQDGNSERASWQAVVLNAGDYL